MVNSRVYMRLKAAFAFVKRKLEKQVWSIVALLDQACTAALASEAVNDPSTRFETSFIQLLLNQMPQY